MTSIHASLLDCGVAISHMIVQTQSHGHDMRWRQLHNYIGFPAKFSEEISLLNLAIEPRWADTHNLAIWWC